MINYIRKSRIISPLALVLVCSILLVSCKKNTEIFVPKATSTEVFRGIFFAEGKVANLIPELSEFQLGNFTDDKNVLTKAYELHSIILKSFEKKYPGYIDAFHAKILTHDHLIIQAALQDGSKKLQTVLQNYYDLLSNDKKTEVVALQKKIVNSLESNGINKNNPKEVTAFIKNYLKDNDMVNAKSVKINGNNAETAVQKEEALVAVVVLVAAAAVALAVVVWSVAAVVEGVVFWTTQATSNPSDSLLQEQMVNSISANL
ncbi:MAG: hypothetical protein WBP45_14050 [Daejeonella sp.]